MPIISAKKYLFLILILTAIIFSNSLQNKFTNWDDDLNITNNLYVQNLSYENIKFLFTNSFADRYTPLTMLFYSSIIKIGGLNAVNFHLASLAIHLLNVVLVFIFIMKLSGNEKVALLTSLFFSIHPNNSESVSWISAGSNLIYSSFFLGGLITYIYYLKDKKIKYYFLTFLFFLLSLLSKPTAIVFPVLLFLVDFYLNIKFTKISFINKIPLFIVAFGVGVVTLIFRGKAHLVDSTTIFNFVDRLFLATYALAAYIAKIFVSFHTSAYNIFPDKNGSFLPVYFYLSAIPLFVLGFFLLKYISRPRAPLKKELLFGFLFFLITISPVLEIVPMGNPDFMGERYTYIPYIGLFFLLNSLALFFLNAKNRYRLAKTILFFLIIIYVVLYSVTTHKANLVWSNSMSLWSNLITYSPLNYEGFYGLGNTKRAMGDYEGAIEAYNRAIKLNPNLAKAYNDRGITKARMGNTKEALLDYDTALKIRPNYSNPYFNRAMIKKTTSSDLEDILNDLNNAAKWNEKFPGTFYERGLLYFFMGKLALACEDFRNASFLNFPPALKALQEKCN